MIKIEQYSEEYRKKVIEFFLKVCVDEYGFEEWKEDIENMDNYTYIDDGGNFWIAVNEENNIIGTIGLRNKGNSVGELKSLYVHKKHREQGIAQDLLNTLINFAKEYEKLILDTYRKFERAIRFYEKNRFTKIQTIGDKLIYERILQNEVDKQICC